MNPTAKATPHFPGLILSKILRFIYLDFLESDESIGAGEHHCSISHPCVLISRSPAFNVFSHFFLISSIWNKRYLNTVDLEAYPMRLQPLDEVPGTYQTLLHRLLQRSVVFKRYRVFRVLENESGSQGVFVAHDFGVTGGCKESREVVIKAWRRQEEEYLIEGTAYERLSTSPMKGFASFIEINEERSSGFQVFAVVLEKLGPSLEDLRRLLPDKRFDEKMILALAIQMVDRYAALHSRGIIHNGVKPGNICLPAIPTDTTLNVIDFGFSFIYNPDFNTIRLRHGRNIAGNRRFWSALTSHGFTQSRRDDLESLGYLFSALFQGSLPWWYSENDSICSMKMMTPSSVLFRDMDPSFLEYWKDVRTLAFNEVPDYCSLKSRFVQCWERKELGGLPGEYDWLTLFNKLKQEST